MFEILSLISANELFLLLTPISVFVLIVINKRSTDRVAKRVEEVRKITAAAVSLTAKEVAATVLEQSKADKKDLDDKLEVIRIDVNSNLTAALKEIEDLKNRLGITEENPEGFVNQIKL